MRVSLFVLVLFVFPVAAHAAVTISEVAWMGNADSANDEWIELYNSGASVSVDGWTLSDGMNLSIPLLGTIDAGKYAVLERTDDSTVAGSAFLVYTGALTNTGATLTLTRADGSIEDQVAGGEDWKNIGGDNTTKETAQYTESGWVTGSPTPGTENVSYVMSTQEKPKAAAKDSSDSTLRTLVRKEGSRRTGVPLELPDVTLMLTLSAPTIAYVNQPIDLSLTADGVGETMRASLSYAWNFGDLTTQQGKDVVHAYAYPGTYVVVGEAGYKRQHATIRHEITILPVTFSLTTNSDGDLQINNDARYEVDLSGYSIRGEETIVFPDNTILLPNATLTIPRERIGNAYAFLMDQEHVVVASTMPEQPVQIVATPVAPVVAVAETASPFLPPSSSESTIPENFVFSEPTVETVLAKSKKAIATNTVEVPETQAALVSEATPAIPKDKLPYLGLIGVLSVGMLALYAGRSQK